MTPRHGPGSYSGQVQHQRGMIAGPWALIANIGQPRIGATGIARHAQPQSAGNRIGPTCGQRGRGDHRVRAPPDPIIAPPGPALRLRHARRQIHAEPLHQRSNRPLGVAQRIVQVAQNQPGRRRRVGKPALDQTLDRLRLQPSALPGFGGVRPGGLEMNGEQGQRPEIDHQAISAEYRALGRHPLGHIQRQIHRTQTGVTGRRKGPAGHQRHIPPGPVIARQTGPPRPGGNARRHQQAIVEIVQRLAVEHLLQRTDIGVRARQNLRRQPPVSEIKRPGLRIGPVGAVARAVQAIASLWITQAQVLHVEGQDPHFAPSQHRQRPRRTSGQFIFLQILKRIRPDRFTRQIP